MFCQKLQTIIVQLYITCYVLCIATSVNNQTMNDQSFIERGGGEGGEGKALAVLTPITSFPLKPILSMITSAVQGPLREIILES